MKKRIIALVLIPMFLILSYRNQKADALAFLAVPVIEAIGELAISAGATFYAVDHLDKLADMVKDEVQKLSGKSPEDLNALFDGSASVTVTDWLVKGVNSVLGYLKTNPVVNDTTTISIDNTYQNWVNYPHSPVLTNDYKYQVLTQNNYSAWSNSDIYLIVSPNKLFHNNIPMIKEQPDLANMYRYHLVNNVWVLDGSGISAWNITGRTIIQANNAIYDNDTLTTVYFDKTTPDTTTTNINYNYTNYVTNVPNEPQVQVQPGSKVIIPSDMTKDSLINKQTINDTGANVYQDTSIATNTQTIADALSGDLSDTLTDDLTSSVTGQYDVGNLNLAWDSIKNMNTTRTEAPKFYINLGALYNASVGRFSSTPSPWANADRVFIDFGKINTDIKFLGNGIFDYVRMLLGVGFIWTTFMYVWRKVTPDKVIPD